MHPFSFGKNSFLIVKHIFSLHCFVKFKVSYYVNMFVMFCAYFLCSNGVYYIIVNVHILFHRVLIKKGFVDISILVYWPISIII